MRILGLDFGSKTVGVAVSDELLFTAQGVETIERKEENKLRKTCARIEELIREQNVEKIVLGLPKHMNNDIGERAEHALAFGEMLRRRTGLPVVMWDERLTTVEAERTLKEREIPFRIVASITGRHDAPERKREALEAFFRHYGIPLYDSFDELLEHLAGENN